MSHFTPKTAAEAPILPSLSSNPWYDNFMVYLIIKALLTGVIAVTISEIAKRSSLLAAVLASLPLTTILAFIWMYLDQGNADQIPELSHRIFWMVVPSLSFFLIFPYLLKTGLKFFPSLLISCIGMSLIYTGYVKALAHFKIEI